MKSPLRDEVKFSEREAEKVERSKFAGGAVILFGERDNYDYNE